jgi:hypothetical protein
VKWEKLERMFVEDGKPCCEKGTGLFVIYKSESGIMWVDEECDTGEYYYTRMVSPCDIIDIDIGMEWSEYSIDEIIAILKGEYDGEDSCDD